MNLRRLLSFRWVLTTLLFLAASGVMVRLGIWQLDRLEQRRAFNSRVTAQLNAPGLDLNQTLPVDQLNDMEYRTVTVTGEFVHADQVLLRNQVREGLPGYHLLTPLEISGSDQLILIDRGWIPFDQIADLSRFDQPGEVTITGQLRRPQDQSNFTPGVIQAPPNTNTQQSAPAVNTVSITQVQEFSGVPMLPAFIQQAEVADRTEPPFPALTSLELSEGPHMGYAIQWFIFAGIFFFGYPLLVRRSLARENAKSASQDADQAPDGVSPKPLAPDQRS